MKRLSTVAACAVLSFAATTAAGAAPILEVEVNSSLAGAQGIPTSAFTLPVPATVFNPPGFPTATISGFGGGGDVDFYAFTSSGGSVYFDIDNNPFSFDTILSLFDASGTLLALGDDSFAPDPGSADGFDSFLGVLTLPGPGTYYLAVSAFNNFPNAVNNSHVVATLIRPGGGFGGFTVDNAAVGDSSYSNPATGNATAPYTLHVSVQNPGTQAVPEPMTLLLFGSGLTAAAVRMRRRR